MTAYREPPAFVVRVFKPVVSLLVRCSAPRASGGWSFAGARAARGGACRSTSWSWETGIISSPRGVRRSG